MKKRIVTLALVLVFLMTMTGVGMATQTISTEEGKNVTVTYGVTEGFTVTIPANFDLSTTESEKTVSASGVLIPTGEQLTVTMSSANFETTDKYRVKNDTSYIKYTVKKGAASASATELTSNGDTILTVGAGTTSGSIKLYFSTTQTNIDAATKAGNHTDTLTFTVAVGTP